MICKITKSQCCCILRFKMLPGVGNKCYRGLEFLEWMKQPREPVCACPRTEGGFSLTQLAQVLVIFCVLALTTLVWVYTSATATFQSLKSHYLVSSEPPKSPSPQRLPFSRTISQGGHPNSTLASESKAFSFLFHSLGILFFFIRDKNVTK